MASYSVDAEPGVVSELVDLDPIPLSELRKLDHAVLLRSLQHVVTRTTHTEVIADGRGGAERVN